MSITQSKELYQYHSYHETVLTYGNDAADSHPTNPFWYLDKGDMLSCGPTEGQNAKANSGFIIRWNRIKQRKENQLHGRLQCDLCNVPLYSLAGIRLQIKLTKAGSALYIMNSTADSKTTFKSLDVYFL